MMVDSTPDQVDPPGEVALHMGGGGRRDVAGQVGRRRHHGTAERAQDFPRHRVGGHPDRDGFKPRGGEIGHRAIACLGQDQRQRSRPERPGQRDRLRVEAGDPHRGLDIPDMGDQRVEGGAALGLVEPGDGGGIAGIGAKPIDRLGRERDQAAPGKAARRRRCGPVCRQNLRFQAHIHSGHVLNSASCGMRNPRL
jgi:hypothetical protein